MSDHAPTYKATRSRLSGEKNKTPAISFFMRKLAYLSLARGFIGSALVHALNQRGIEQIVVTDALGEDEKWRNLRPLTFEDYVPADDFLDGIEETSDKFGRFAAVFHLGACSSTTVTDSDFVLRNNYAYTKSLCRWALFLEPDLFTPPPPRPTAMAPPAWMTKLKISRASVR